MTPQQIADVRERLELIDRLLVEIRVELKAVRERLHADAARVPELSGRR